MPERLDEQEPADAGGVQRVIRRVPWHLAMYAKDGGTLPEPVAALTWPYLNAQVPTAAELLREISGRAIIRDGNDQNLMVTMKLEVKYRLPTPTNMPVKVVG